MKEPEPKLFQDPGGYLRLDGEFMKISGEFSYCEGHRCGDDVAVLVVGERPIGRVAQIGFIALLGLIGAAIVYLIKKRPAH